MKAISMIGMAGSGKSLVGRNLANKLGYSYISTGDLARKLKENEWLLTGNLAPENLIRDLFLKEVKILLLNGCKGVVVDGIPRIADQVNFLVDTFNEILFIDIYVQESVAIKRLCNRNRTDDNLLEIGKRIEIFNNNICRICSRIQDFIKKDEDCYSYISYDNNGEEFNVDSLVNVIIANFKQK